MDISACAGLRFACVGRVIVAPAVFATLLVLPLRAAAETWSYRCDNGVQFTLLNAYAAPYERGEPPVILSYRGKQYPLWPFIGASWWGFFGRLGSDGTPDSQPGYSVGFYTSGTSLGFNNTKVGAQCRKVTRGA